MTRLILLLLILITSPALAGQLDLATDPFTQWLFRHDLCPSGLNDPYEYTHYCFYGPWPSQRDRQPLALLTNPIPYIRDARCSPEGFARWKRHLGTLTSQLPDFITP